MNNDLRHQFTEMETKFRSVNETKAQICELLTSRREQSCSKDWIRTEDRCYFISTLEISYDGAKNSCSNFDARLLEINSKKEQDVVSNATVHHHRTYWIGKCEDGKAASGLMFKDYTGTSVCGSCDLSAWRNRCNHQNHFICEKCAHLCTDIPAKIQDLCQQSLGPT
ncbi:C-type lectin domain family 7 member A-like [Hemitrygon akajei]|uniref:C-type lectin domain family 7 member A-like n=1 Tax=Hemitrygon akajei TaxID=2704970 RepID=UPI003BF9441D